MDGKFYIDNGGGMKKLLDHVFGNNNYPFTQK